MRSHLYTTMQKLLQRLQTSWFLSSQWCEVNPRTRCTAFFVLHYWCFRLAFDVTCSLLFVIHLLGLLILLCSVGTTRERCFEKSSRDQVHTQLLKPQREREPHIIKSANSHMSFGMTLRACASCKATDRCIDYLKSISKQHLTL